MCIGMIDYLNETSIKFKPLIEAADSLFGLLISIGLFCIAYQANKISKEQHNRLRYKISEDEREIFRSNYTRLTEGLGHVMREGRVKDEAKNLFWQVRDQARLELPKEIQDYTQKIFDLMWEAYIDYYHKIYDGDGQPVNHPERSEAIKRNTEIVLELIRLKPSELYSKYMKVDL